MPNIPAEADAQRSHPVGHPAPFIDSNTLALGEPFQDPASLSLGACLAETRLQMARQRRLRPVAGMFPQPLHEQIRLFIFN